MVYPNNLLTGLSSSRFSFLPFVFFRKHKLNPASTFRAPQCTQEVIQNLLEWNNNSLSCVLLLNTTYSHIPFSYCKSHALTSLLHVSYPSHVLLILFQSSDLSSGVNSVSFLQHSPIPHTPGWECPTVALPAACILKLTTPWAVITDYWSVCLPERNSYCDHNWNTDSAVIGILELKQKGY